MGNAVSFCKGNSLTLNAHNPNSTYVWNTGANTPNITVTTGGTYWVSVANSCGVTKDTVQVYVDKPLNVNLGSTKYLCGGTVTLQPNTNPLEIYQWNTGAITPSIQVSTPGTYWVKISNACGSFTDTVEVKSGGPDPSFSLGNDIVECQANSVILSIPNNIQGNFSWAGGGNSRTKRVQSSGTYIATVTTPCGSHSDTINVFILPRSGINLPDTVWICPGQQKTIATNFPGSHLWHNGSTSSSITVSQPGSASVRVNNPCGTFRDTAVVARRNKPQFDLGADTTVCGSLMLQGPRKGTRLWSTGSSKEQITVADTGKYWLKVTNSCGSTTDTIKVNVRKSPFLNIDTLGYCTDTAALANAGVYGPDTRYIWSNGDTTQFTIFQQNAKEWVTVTNGCGSYTDTFYVRKDQDLQFSIPDTVHCDSVPLYIHIPNFVRRSTDSVRWHSGSNSDSISISLSGRYWLELINSCDTVREYFRATIFQVPIPLRKSIYFRCDDSSQFRLNPPMPPSAQRVWSTGDSTKAILVDSAGIYPLMTYSRCDTVRDTIEVKNSEPIDLELGSDTIFCRPDSLIIPLPFAPGNKFYLNGNRLLTPVAVITQTGQYIVRGSNGCGDFYDTINVQVFDPPRRLQDNIKMCRGSQATLDVTQQAAVSYRWNTGASSPTITVNQSGWYWVDISTRCATLRDSAFVLVQDSIPPFDLGNDTIFCDGELKLDPGFYPGASYRWQNGSTYRSITATYSDTYWVRVKNKCNTRYDTIKILITGPPKSTLGVEVQYCAVNTLNLNAKNPGSSYLWNTGDTTQQISVSKPGKYWVRITNDCGEIVDTVQAVPQYPLNNLNLGRDTLICRGDSLLLDPLTRTSRLRWSTGSLDSSISVKKSGLYHVQVMNLCGVFFDSIQVTVLDTPFFDLPDTSICYKGDFFRVRSPFDSLCHTWSDGSHGKTFDVREPGDYWLQLENKCFSYKDHFEIEPQFPIDFKLPEDTASCGRDTLYLDVSHVKHPVEWNDGSRKKIRPVTQSGLYSLKAYNRCGPYYDSTRVFLHESLNDSTLQPGFCVDDSVHIDWRDRPYDLLWEDGSTAQSRYLSDTVSISVQIENLCGKARYTYEPQVIACGCPVYMPDAFTPNGDGLNDRFAPVTECDIESMRLTIFDRWGKVLYRGSDRMGWDGSSEGQSVKAGVYIYDLTVRYQEHGLLQHKNFQGTVTLIR